MSEQGRKRNVNSLSHMRSRTHRVPREGGIPLEQPDLFLHQDGWHKSARSQWAVHVDHVAGYHGVYGASCAQRAKGMEDWPPRELLGIFEVRDASS